MLYWMDVQLVISQSQLLHTFRFRQQWIKFFSEH
jgi:hypothetical protein